MLGITRRRRVMSGAAALVMSGTLVFVGGTSAYADGVGLAPIIPAAASVAEATCVAAGVETLGTACAVAGVGLLAVGAWFAFQNADTIMSWINPSAPDQGQEQKSGAILGIAWSASVPSPGAGPYDQAASSIDPFTAQEVAFVGSSASYGAKAWCVDAAGTVSGPESEGGSSGASWPFVAGTVHQAPIAACTRVAGLRVAQYEWDVYNASGTPDGPYLQLVWTAGGTWATTRTQTTTVTCKTPGAGTTTETVTQTFTTTAAVDSATIPSCPSGTYISNVTVHEGPAALPAAGRDVVKWHTTGTPESTYPACFTGSSPGLGGCLLSVTYNGTACSTSEPMCADWQTNSRFGTTGYSCLWGPYTLPLTSCAPLANSWKPGAVTDPSTGLPTVPGASPSPSASATATTSAQPQPTTGPNPAPTSAATLTPWTQAPNPFPTDGSTPTAAPQPPEPPPSGQNCMESGWSWNPVSWVYVPVRCVLVWAFVPDSAAVAQVQTEASSAWSSSSPGLWTAAAFTALGPLGNIGSAESGTYACGIPVHFPFYTGHSIDFVLLNSCTPPLDTLAPIVKGFLTAVIIVNGIWLSLRILGAAFGWQLPGIGRGAAE